MRRIRFLRGSYSEKELVAGIIARDEIILNLIYYKQFPVIERMVSHNGGTKDEARDIFHDAFLVILQKALRPDFCIDCSLSTFLFSICNNLWLKRLRSRKYSIEGVNVIKHDRICDDNTVPEFDQEYASLIKKKLFWKHFNNLYKDCQTILQMTFLNHSDQEIASSVGFKNKDDVIKRRSRCKFYLISSVRHDPLFNEIFDYE